MKIFLIDDDYLSLFVTQTKLTFAQATLEIKTFLSAAEALQALQMAEEECIPEIIFLDLHMPVMDGWDFLEALSPLQARLQDRCCIYVLTSSLDQADADRIKLYPLVSALLPKPLEREKISSILSLSSHLKATPVS